MSLIDVKEEFVSDVDMNLEINPEGLSLSVFIDLDELSHKISYEGMAYSIIDEWEAGLIYDKEYDSIIDNLQKLVRDLRDAREQ
jgi:hypothetical protein